MLEQKRTQTQQEFDVIFGKQPMIDETRVAVMKMQTS
jgi:hypothetical protein